jgi:uncharacterized Rossmann fold enzyme
MATKTKAREAVFVEDAAMDVLMPTAEEPEEFPPDIRQNICEKLGIDDDQLSAIIDGHGDNLKAIAERILRHREFPIKPLSREKLNKAIQGALNKQELKWWALQVPYE